MRIQVSLLVYINNTSVKKKKKVKYNRKINFLLNKGISSIGGATVLHTEG